MNRRFALACVVGMALAGGAWADINWDGDDAVGNFTSCNNWYGNSCPTLPWAFTYGSLVFNYRNNGSQTSLYYDLSWSDNINDIIWETTFGAGLSLNGNGQGINFNQRLENRSSYAQTVNIPLSGAKNGASQIELNPVNGDLILNSNIYNDNTKPYFVYGNNAKMLTINTGLGYNATPGNVSLTIDKGVGSGICEVKLTAAQSWGDGTHGVTIKQGELWIDSGGSLLAGIPVVVGQADGNTAKLWLSVAAGGTTEAHAITVNGTTANTKTLGGLNTSGTHTFSGVITLNGPVTLEANGTSGSVVFTNAIAGTGMQTATVDGPGTVLLVGTANNTNLAINATGGTLLLGKSGSSGTLHAVDSGLTVAGALVKITGSPIATGDQIYDNSALTVNSGTFDINGRGETVDAFSGSGGVVTNTGAAATLVVGNAGSGGTYSGSIGGNMQLTKAGAGALTLSGNNNYTRQTLVNTGTLNINSATAIGSGTLNIGGSITFDNSSAGDIVLANNNCFTFSGGSPIFAGTHSLDFGSGSVTNSGANRNLTVNGSTLTFGGGVTDNGNARKITKAGAGTLALNGAAGVWTGGSEVDAGTLVIGNDAALGTGAFTLGGGTVQSRAGSVRSLTNAVLVTANSSIGGGDNFTVNSGGTFTFSGGSRTLTVTNVATTILAGNVYLSDTETSTRTQTFTGPGTVVISAPIANNNAGNTVAANMAYSGSSTLTLSSMANSYSGNTLVSGGILRVNGSIASSALTVVFSGGTLGGTGTVGTLNVQNGGKVAPGASVGTLNAGNTTWDTNGVYLFEINDFAGAFGGDANSNGWDKLAITGTLTNLATAGRPFTIQITSLSGTNSGAAANFTNSMSYALNIATASVGIVGFSASNFSLNTNNFQNAMNGGTWSIQTSGNNVQLVFTPPAGPMISVGPGSLSYTTMLGTAPAAQTFGVTNVSGGAMTYTNNVTYSTGATSWVTNAPGPAPLSAGQSQVVTASVAVVGAVGTFSATNTITGNFTNANPVLVMTLTVTNIPSPTGATATADGKELIRLAWTKAGTLNTLILADTNAIATDPTQGTPYAVGAGIGTATVIYNGSGTALEHLVPPARNANYKFYAVNNSYYSPSASAGTATASYRVGEIVDQFAYTNATSLSGRNGGQGFSSGWSLGAGGWTNSSGSFGNVAGYPANGGNKVLITPPNDTACTAARTMSSTINTGRIYVAFLMNYQYNGANKWCGLSLMDGGTEKAFFGEIYTQDEKLGLSANSVDTGSSYTLLNGAGNDYLVIGLYDFSTRDLKVKGYYKTDTVPKVEPASWDASTTLGAGYLTQVTAIRLGSGAGAGAGTPGDTYFDEARVATNWGGLLGLNGPGLGVAPAVLTFNATLGSTPASQSFIVTNVGEDVLSYTNTVTYSTGASGWAGITPATGLVSYAGSQAHTVTVGLVGTVGSFSATNTVSGNQTNVAQTVVFTLNITNVPDATAVAAITNTAAPDTKADLAWTRPGTHSVLIVRRIGSNPEAPVNGTAYTTNDTYGSGNGNMVIYKSTGGAFTDSGLTASTVYYYGFFAANGSYYAPGVFTNVTTAAGNPLLSVGPGALTFSTMLGSAPAAQTFGVTNIGTGTLTYSNNVTYSTGAADWVTNAPAPVPLAGGVSQTQTVSIAVVGAVGTFMATNTVSGNQNNAALTVVLTLTVTNIPSPTGATATADGKELIRLAWTKAGTLNTLILADTNAIATDPTQGTPYAVGAGIGTATVIYNGSGTALEHLVPPARNANYKFYAVNNNYYSPSASAGTATASYRVGEIVDQFAYTNATSLSGRNGGQGFSSGWSLGAGGWTNSSGSFGNVAGYPANGGNKVLITPPNDTACTAARTMSSTINTGRIYVAFLMNYQYNGANKWCGLSLMDGGTEKAFFGEIYTQDEKLGLSANSVDTGSSYTLLNGAGNDYLVIGLYDFSTRDLKVKGYYKTDTVPKVEPASWDASTTLGAGYLTQVTAIRLGSGAGAGAGTPGDTYFDEARVATNWFELLNLTGPVLSVYPATLSYSAPLGQNPTPQTQTYSVSNLNVGTLSYTSAISYGPGASGWFAVAPATGTVAAASGVAETGTVTCASLWRGTYTATNTFYAGDAGTQSVVVTLSVTGYNGQVSYDTFDETSGNILEGKNGGYGWSGAWSDNSDLGIGPLPYVGSTSLATFDNYCNDGSFDAAIDMGNCGGGNDPCSDLYREAYRAFPQISSGVVYLGFKLKGQNNGTGIDYGVMLGDNGNFKVKVGKVDANDDHLGIKTTDGQTLTTYGIGGAGSEYLILMRYDLDSGEIKVKGHYGNDLSTTESWETTTRTAPAGSTPLNRITLYARNGLAGETVGIVQWDDVRIATTWSDLLCGLGYPQDYPVVSNVTFYGVDSSNSVSDATLNSGNFPISMTFYDQLGVAGGNTNAPFFNPNFDLVNSSGGQIVQDRLFVSTNFASGGITLVGSNATISPVTSVNIPVGTVALRWSAINSNQAYRINDPKLANGSNITFNVYDDDTVGPTPTLLFIGANYTPGAMQTNITDADLANTNNLADIAVRWDDPSGVFMTNSPPSLNDNIGSENGRVIPNWDLFTSNTVTGVTNAYGYDQVFNHFVGNNGANSVTTWYANAFVITNIDFNNVFYLTASAEDEDNDRGTYISANGDTVPYDRTVITNALTLLGVVDDDSTPPALTAFRLFGNSRGTSVVTGGELGSGGWSITGIVQDVYSGLRVNGTSTNEPDNSPYLRILDPSGAVRYTQVLTNGIANSDTNTHAVAVSGVSITGSIQGGLWTAQVVVSDTDADRPNDALTATNTIVFAVPTFEWDAGGGADRDWHQVTNWTADMEPTAIDTAFINGGYTAVVASAGAVASNLFVGDNGFDGGSDNGTGTVDQAAGALTVQAGLMLGENPGDLGRYLISGGSLSVTGVTTVGSAGLGLMTVTGTAAVASIGDFVIGAGGAGAEDHGSQLSIDGGSVTAWNNLVLGNSGGADGTLVLNAGTLAVSRILGVGSVAGATGTVTISSGALTVGGTASGQNLRVGDAGRGVMTIAGDATVNVINSRSAVIGNAAGNGADNVLHVTGGALNVSNNVVVGNAAATRGTLDVSGGHVQTHVDLRVGGANSSTGIVTVSAGQVTVIGSLAVGSSGLGTLTASGGSVTAAVIVVSDAIGSGGSTLNVQAGARMATSGTGQFNMDYAGTLNVSGGELAADQFDIGTVGGQAVTVNLSGGTITAGNEFNVGAGSDATGTVNQTGGTLQLASGQALVISGQGATGNRNGIYVITNGTIAIAAGVGAGADQGDLEIGDADAATGHGVFRVVGPAPAVSIGDDLAMSPQNNGELQFTLVNSAIATIQVGDDINLAGTLTVSNLGAVAEGAYVVITNSSAAGSHLITGSFAATNWLGSAVGHVVVSTHTVTLVFGPEMQVLGTNAALTIPNGDTTPTTADGSDFGNVLVDTTQDNIFTITNINASYTLNLISNPAVALSGATNFTVALQPASTNLGPLAAAAFTARLAPSGLGTVTATVSIANSDPLQNPYQFRIVGTGVLAVEPTLPASNLVFSAVSNAQMTVSWQRGDGSNRLLVVKAASSFTNVPADGVVYPANSVFTNGAPIATGVYAIYSGSSTNMTVTGLLPGTTYYFALYEDNGFSGNINYLTTTALTGNQTTLTFPPIITEGASVTVNMSENGNPTAFSLMLNATDADEPYGDVIHWDVQNAPFHGSASASGTGDQITVSYTPLLYFSGTDSFIVRAYDNYGNADTITVNVNVAAINQAGQMIIMIE